MSVVTAPADGSHAAGLVALFERTGSPCFCRWWHFAGDKNAWLDRCANRPQDSRAEFEGALAEGSAEARGIVAMDAEGVVVGWMKLAPAMALPKLFEQRLYKGLPSLKGERSGVWVIGCFLIDESWRRRGVAGALLDRGIVSARSAGATSIEACPRRAQDVAAQQSWTGPFELYRSRGFAIASDLAQYPVRRLALGSNA